MARGFNYAPGASAEVQAALEPELTKEQLVEFGASRNALVRAAVAARSDCPLGLMVTLAHDYSAEVRAEVARNSHAQRTVMTYLSMDRSVDVLKALLENPSLPGELVEELAFHKKAPVRAAAAARLDAGQIVVLRAAEDAHTPELAEHVAPVAQMPMTADGAVAQAPLAPVVDIATGAARTWDWAPDRADGHAQYPVAPPAAAATSPTVPAPGAPHAGEPAIPQIFAPHSTPDHPAPTRTAPVRGFKPKE